GANALGVRVVSSPPGGRSRPGPEPPGGRRARPGPARPLQLRVTMEPLLRDPVADPIPAPPAAAVAPTAQAGIIGWAILWWMGVPFFVLLIVWLLFFR